MPNVKGAAGTMCNLASSISSWLVAYFFSFLLQWSSTEEGLFVPLPSESSTSLLSEISNASTRAFVLAFTVGSCGAFAFGCIIGYSAPTQSGIMKDLNLSIADAIFTFWIDIDGGASPWSINLWKINRFGWPCLRCLAARSWEGPVYITEIAPRNLRGAASSMAQLFAGVGISVFYALGTVVSWRNLAILGSIPSLMVLPLLFFIPESPRWLAKVGREKEVEAVLLSLRGETYDVSDEATEILEYTEHAKQQQDIDGHGFFKLFQRKYAFSLTIGVVLIALPQLGGLNGYSFYTDSIFTSTGVSSDFGFMSISVVQMLGGILGTVLIDVSGRRTLLLENRCWETETPILALFSVFWIIWARHGINTMDHSIRVSGLGFVFIAKLVPETKGKSLEEIQSLFTDCPTQYSIVGYSAPTQSGIMKDLNLSYSLFGSILTVGIIIGALISGKLTDMVGRIYDIWMLDSGRLLHGIALGISIYVGPIYITEITPRNLRGAVSSFTQLFAILGSSAFYALGTVVAWRKLAILGAIPFLVIVPLLFCIPESPRWLAKVGREKEVKAVLLRLRGEETDISDEAKEILEYTEHVKQQEDGDRGFFKLFQRKYAFSLTIGVTLIALPDLGGLTGYSLYTDSIFTSTGVSSDFGFITTSLVQENHCWETGTPILALISVLLYFASYGIGMSSIPWLIASEIYPVDVKGAAGTVCNLIGSISSWLVAYSFNFLLQWSSTGIFLIYATVSGLGLLFIAQFVPETKGKSLEEIQSFFVDSPFEETTS
ncbi:unnamed protein product [Thlaspi arvense]|uniref:Major facilitator superfamily (MFS) profile domain-containing protein n=1 Tax=Thlaspi arvense TaxID=13288 RepID=A0AAU9SVQ2_THLAR|nr:unnamed protein product [Thlaspi arvense]